MFEDLRLALRLLIKERGFTVTALLTLALCIGANTAIFSVLEAVVLDPLPYPESSRLIHMGNAYPGVGITEGLSNSAPDYMDRRQLTDIFDSVAATHEPGFDLQTSDAQRAPLHIAGESVTPSFFQVLRTWPMLGRAFTESDATPGNDHFAILSYGLWSDAFGKDPAIAGKEIRLNGRPYRVTGVMPQGFSAPGVEARIWVPLSFTAADVADDNRHSNGLGMIARLRPGVSIEAVRQRIAAVNHASLDRTPQLKKLIEQSGFYTEVRPLKDVLVKSVRPILLVLQAAVAFVLLIGCVNVANLLLVRSQARAREWAIRFSLGASRARLARQVFTETGLLTAAGAIAGIFLSFAGVRLLTTLGGDSLPRGGNIAVNGAVLAFTAATALLTGLIFGALPVYHLLHRDLEGLARGSQRGSTASRGALWTRSALVVSQVCLAIVLLTGAGLLTVSFSRLLAVNPGFRPENTVTAAFSMSGARYPDQAAARVRLSDFLTRVRAIPGVSAAGITTELPFSANHQDGAIQIEGHVMSPGELPADPDWNTADGGYFAAMRIPIVEGRAFDDRDGAGAPNVVIIDEYLARRYWPHGGAIGNNLRLGLNSQSPLLRIVGVAGPVKSADLAEHNRQGMLYLPYAQHESARAWSLVARTETGDASIPSAIRAELQRVDPTLAMFDVKSMGERISASIGNRRAAMLLCLMFSLAALCLSALGIYGVLAYSAAQRTREFGIRMALGATAAQVLGLVMRQGLQLAAIGGVIGLAGAAALTHLLASLLYDVRATDPYIYAAALAILISAASVASLVPALRAVRIQPSTALRDE